MAKKSNSQFSLWYRHISLALALIVIAAVVIVIQGRFDSKPVPEGGEKSKSLSKGMTDFYTAYRLSSSKPFENNLGDFVIDVNKPDEPLSKRLQKMESIQKPVSKRWQGAYKYRSFRAGNTLREAITNYAQSEGMQLIWELDQDFIVKHPFQLQDSVVGSLKKIAMAIDSNFDGEVRAFFCPKQRSLVITNGSTTYLRKHCSEARS